MIEREPGQEQERELPPYGCAIHCESRDCPCDFIDGYGYAGGGGVGPYEYCDVCGRVVSKTAEGEDT